MFNVVFAAGVTVVPNVPAYSATKTAVVAYTQAWAVSRIRPVNGHDYRAGIII